MIAIDLVIKRLSADCIKIQAITIHFVSTFSHSDFEHRKYNSLSKRNRVLHVVCVYFVAIWIICEQAGEYQMILRALNVHSIRTFDNCSFWDTDQFWDVFAKTVIFIGTYFRFDLILHYLHIVFLRYNFSTFLLPFIAIVIWMVAQLMTYLTYKQFLKTNSS